jgi:hypothetical protein
MKIDLQEPYTYYFHKFFRQTEQSEHKGLSCLSVRLWNCCTDVDQIGTRDMQ